MLGPLTHLFASSYYVTDRHESFLRGVFHFGMNKSSKFLWLSGLSGDLTISPSAVCVSRAAAMSNVLGLEGLSPSYSLGD